MNGHHDLATPPATLPALIMTWRPVAPPPDPLQHTIAIRRHHYHRRRIAQSTFMAAAAAVSPPAQPESTTTATIMDPMNLRHLHPVKVSIPK